MDNDTGDFSTTIAGLPATVKARRRVANRDAGTMMIEMLDKLWKKILAPLYIFSKLSTWNFHWRSGS